MFFFRVLSQNQARIAAWQTTILKTLPFVFLVFLVLETPAVGFLDEDTVNKSWRTGMIVFVMLAFLIELGYSLPEAGNKGHFGTPLLAAFVAISSILAVNYYFEFYTIGDNSQIDAFIYLFFAIALLLLVWQARHEYFKHNRLKLQIFKAFQR